MAIGSQVASDDSILSRIDRWFLKLEIALSLVSGIAVFGLMLLAVVSVGGRNGFNQPLPGYV
ncbi:MAG: TRAP transporter small permease, partial [Boseongicola sp.]|nr:TRAP transporter small permease [Boseongicola sp.]